MRIDNLPNNFTFLDFIELDKDDLDALPYDVYRWNCCCKDCNNGTTIRDYGFSPNYFLNRNSKKSKMTPQIYWFRVDVQRWFCGKHFEYLKRLGDQIMWDKFIDHDKEALGSLVKKVNQQIEKLG